MFSAHTFAWTTPNTLQLRYRFGFDACLVKRVCQAEQHYTLHCTYGQLFVLHCAAGYHSDLLLYIFIQTSKIHNQRIVLAAPNIIRVDWVGAQLGPPRSDSSHFDLSFIIFSQVLARLTEMFVLKIFSYISDVSIIMVTSGH